MKENYTYIDFDGVVLDSEARMLERKFLAGYKNHKCSEEYDAYFEYTNLHPEEWNYIIREANEINDSVKIIKELELLDEKIAILTKCHTLYEMKAKIEDIRIHREITCPVILVPPCVKKHQIIIPNNQLLIDDSNGNINNWILNGGKGLIFDPTIPENTERKVKSLEFLIKR